MKKQLLKLSSALFALLLLFSTVNIPVSASSYVTGANSASSSYRASVYYENLNAVPITGDGRTDVLAVALSQLGYQEGDENGQFGGTASGSNNFTEYNYNMGDFGQGYGTNNYHWCASFVSFCLLQARCHTQTRIADWCRNHKGDSTYIWREVSCNQWATQLRTCGYFEDSEAFDGDYTPLPGDLIFFKKPTSSLESHIGIVLYATDSTVYTVEGNTSSASGLETNGGGVYMKSYSRSSSYIRGYGVLPYEVNNDSHRIDYSGTNISAGLYVATTNKFVYTSETATSYTWLLPRYTMFTVTEIAGNGRVKATCKINGETVTGYIKNNTDRIVQLSAKNAPATYQPLSEIWGYESACLDYYYVNSSASAVLTNTSRLTVGDKLGISGWLGFTRPLSSVGYFFDSDKATVYWDASALSAPESAVTSAGGEHAMRYKIMADTAKSSAGTHTVTFVAELTDGTVTEIASIGYSAKNIAAAPAPPTVKEITETSIALTEVSGYEYSMNGGAWQTSNVFEGLEEGTPYSFTQRVAETSTAYASAASTITTVTTKVTPVETTTAKTTTTVEPVTTEPPPDITTVPKETTVPDMTTHEPPPLVEVTVIGRPNDTADPTDSTVDISTAAPEDPIEPSDSISAVESDPVSDGTDGTHTEPDASSTASADTTDPKEGCASTAPFPVLAFACLPAFLLIRKREDE